VRILVACEYSGAVRDAFIAKGHEALSCDLLPTDVPGPHYQGDVRDVLDYPWDMMIAFPPCTHLAVSGAKHFAGKRLQGLPYHGASFFLMLARQPIPKICIENPVGVMSSIWRKPDQIIQPWQFGDTFQKTTCLWLKGLPPLQPTKIVDKGEFWVSPDGTKRMPKWFSDNKCAKVRSTTFPGIAAAMAAQWSGDAPMLPMIGDLFSLEATA
jgi:hypothetical protein